MATGSGILTIAGATAVTPILGQAVSSTAIRQGIALPPELPAGIFDAGFPRSSMSCVVTPTAPLRPLPPDAGCELLEFIWSQPQSERINKAALTRSAFDMMAAPGTARTGMNPRTAAAYRSRPGKAIAGVQPSGCGV
jgi:hypothetical protein